MTGVYDMSYRATSKWNEENELRCLLIFKKLQREKFSRGKQMEYCRKMSVESQLDSGSISAKVSNYKSVAGVNRPSNASHNTIDIYNKYGHFSTEALCDIINKYRKAIHF